MDRGDDTTDDIGDESSDAASLDRRRSSGDPVLDTVFDRLPSWVVVSLLVLGMAVLGSVKWISSEHGDIPGWLRALWVIVAVPTFAWMLWRAYFWLQRQRSDADPTVHVSEQRPGDPTDSD